MKTPAGPAKPKPNLLRRNGIGTYLEEDEGGARRALPDRSLQRDNAYAHPREPAKISGILPTAHVSPPGGWAKHLGMDLPREGHMQLNSGRSSNVEDRRPRGLGAALRRVLR